jgi:hypothetical protein
MKLNNGAVVVTLLGILLVFAMRHGASAAPKHDLYADRFVTGKLAVFCASPDSLNDAVRALKYLDKKWMTELGCVLLAKEGTEVIKLTPPRITDRGHWRVRLKAPDGTGVTVYTDSIYLNWPDGENVYDALHRECPTCR